MGSIWALGFVHHVMVEAANPSIAKPAAKRSEDPAILEAAREGSEEAIRALVVQHWRDIHRAAYLILGDSHEAEDVAQEAILSAIDHLDGFDERRPFGPWVRKIAVNRSISVARSRATRPSPTDEVSEEVGQGEGASWTDSEIAQAIRALPLEQRVVVVMRHALGYGTDEIADVLELPRGTVGSRLRRGLDQLAATHRRQDG